MDFQHKTTKETRVAYAASWSGALLMHEAQVVKLRVSYEKRHSKTLIDNEPDHLKHQSLNLRVAYASGD